MYIFCHLNHMVYKILYSDSHFLSYVFVCRFVIDNNLYLWCETYWQKKIKNPNCLMSVFAAWCYAEYTHLTSAYDIGLARKHVHNFTFSLVAPLCSEDYLLNNLTDYFSIHKLNISQNWRLLASSIDEIAKLLLHKLTWTFET